MPEPELPTGRQENGGKAPSSATPRRGERPIVPIRNAMSEVAIPTTVVDNPGHSFPAITDTPQVEIREDRSHRSRPCKAHQASLNAELAAGIVA